MPFESEDAESLPGQKDPILALKEKIETSVEMRARATRRYFEITNTSLDDFVGQVAKDPWNIEIDSKDDKSLTLGIFALQQKLGLKADTSPQGCDGVCGPYTFREYAKAKIHFENQTALNKITEEPQQKDKEAERAKENAQDAQIDSAIRRGIGKSNYGGNNDILIRAIENELNPRKEIRFIGGMVVGDFYFGIHKNENEPATVNIIEVTQEEKNKYPGQPIAKIPTLEGRYGDKYEAYQEEAVRCLKKIEKSSIAKDLKELMDVYVKANLKGELKEIYTNNNAKFMNEFGGLLEAISYIYEEQYPAIMSRFIKGEMKDIDLLRMVFEDIFTWAAKSQQRKNLELLRRGTQAMLQEEKI